ncbi:MAG: beta-ketoacyl-ACP synthase 3 [Patescibacteria group bacterium]|nr:beta-ketoacyl-ACP synthase 3 [Patescibacteria group bacterium]
MENQIRSIIVGTGSAIPELVSNDAVAADINLRQRARVCGPGDELLLCDPEWIRERTGIEQRPVAAFGQAPSSLGAIAARKALENARLKPADVGELVVATCTPDKKVPPTATVIHGLLGLPTTTLAYDLNAACSGFLFALHKGDQTVRDVGCNVLVVGAENMTSIANPADRSTRPLFGDGAGAVVLAPSTKVHLPVCLDQPYGLRDCFVGCDGKLCQLIEVPAGGSALPATSLDLDSDLQYLHMDGKKVFEFAVTKFVWMVTEMCRRNGLRLDDIGLIIPHQANWRIIELAAKKLGIARELIRERFVVTVERHGNMSGASIPVALDDAVSAGRLYAGMLVLLVAFGAGLTWAAHLIRWAYP